jgi:hypothetical protein
VPDGVLYTAAQILPSTYVLGAEPAAFSSSYWPPSSASTYCTASGSSAVCQPGYYPSWATSSLHISTPGLAYLNSSSTPTDQAWCAAWLRPGSPSSTSPVPGPQTPCNRFRFGLTTLDGYTSDGSRDTETVSLLAVVPVLQPSVTAVSVLMYVTLPGSPSSVYMSFPLQQVVSTSLALPVDELNTIPWMVSGSTTASMVWVGMVTVDLSLVATAANIGYTIAVEASGSATSTAYPDLFAYSFANITVQAAASGVTLSSSLPWPVPSTSGLGVNGTVVAVPPSWANTAVVSGSPAVPALTGNGPLPSATINGIAGLAYWMDATTYGSGTAGTSLVNSTANRVSAMVPTDPIPTLRAPTVYVTLGTPPSWSSTVSYPLATYVSSVGTLADVRSLVTSIRSHPYNSALATNLAVLDLTAAFPSSAPDTTIFAAALAAQTFTAWQREVADLWESRVGMDGMVLSTSFVDPITSFRMRSAVVWQSPTLLAASTAALTIGTGVPQSSDVGWQAAPALWLGQATPTAVSGSLACPLMPLSHPLPIPMSLPTSVATVTTASSIALQGCAPIVVQGAEANQQTGLATQAATMLPAQVTSITRSVSGASCSSPLATANPASPCSPSNSACSLSLIDPLRCELTAATQASIGTSSLQWFTVYSQSDVQSVATAVVGSVVGDVYHTRGTHLITVQNSLAAAVWTVSVPTDRTLQQWTSANGWTNAKQPASGVSGCWQQYRNGDNTTLWWKHAPWEPVYVRCSVQPNDHLILRFDAQLAVLSDNSTLSVAALNAIQSTSQYELGYVGTSDVTLMAGQDTTGAPTDELPAALLSPTCSGCTVPSTRTFLVALSYGKRLPTTGAPICHALVTRDTSNACTWPRLGPTLVHPFAGRDTQPWLQLQVWAPPNSDMNPVTDTADTVSVTTGNAPRVAADLFVTRPVFAPAAGLGGNYAPEAIAYSTLQAYRQAWAMANSNDSTVTGAGTTAVSNLNSAARVALGSVSLSSSTGPSATALNLTSGWEWLYRGWRRLYGGVEGPVDSALLGYYYRFAIRSPCSSPVDTSVCTSSASGSGDPWLYIYRTDPYATSVDSFQAPSSLPMLSYDSFEPARLALSSVPMGSTRGRAVTRMTGWVGSWSPTADIPRTMVYQTVPQLRLANQSLVPPPPASWSTQAGEGWRDAAPIPTDLFLWLQDTEVGAPALGAHGVSVTGAFQRRDASAGSVFNAMEPQIDLLSLSLSAVNSSLQAWPWAFARSMLVDLPLGPSTAGWLAFAIQAHRSNISVWTEIQHDHYEAGAPLYRYMDPYGMCSQVLPSTGAVQPATATCGTLPAAVTDSSTGSPAASALQAAQLPGLYFWQPYCPGYMQNPSVYSGSCAQMLALDTGAGVDSPLCQCSDSDFIQLGSVPYRSYTGMRPNLRLQAVQHYIYTQTRYLMETLQPDAVIVQASRLLGMEPTTPVTSSTSVPTPSITAIQTLKTMVQQYASPAGGSSMVSSSSSRSLVESMMDRMDLDTLLLPTSTGVLTWSGFDAGFFSESRAGYWSGVWPSSGLEIVRGNEPIQSFVTPFINQSVYLQARQRMVATQTMHHSQVSSAWQAPTIPDSQFLGTQLSLMLPILSLGQPFVAQGQECSNTVNPIVPSLLDPTPWSGQVRCSPGSLNTAIHYWQEYGNSEYGASGDRSDVQALYTAQPTPTSSAGAVSCGAADAQDGVISVRKWIDGATQFPTYVLMNTHTECYRQATLCAREGCVLVADSNGQQTLPAGCSQAIQFTMDAVLGAVPLSTVTATFASAVPNGATDPLCQAYYSWRLPPGSTILVYVSTATGMPIEVSSYPSNQTIEVLDAALLEVAAPPASTSTATPTPTPTGTSSPYTTPYPSSSGTPTPTTGGTSGSASSSTGGGQTGTPSPSPYGSSTGGSSSGGGGGGGSTGSSTGSAGTSGTPTPTSTGSGSGTTNSTTSGYSGGSTGSGGNSTTSALASVNLLMPAWSLALVITGAFVILVSVVAGLLYEQSKSSRRYEFAGVVFEDYE